MHARTRTARLCGGAIAYKGHTFPVAVLQKSITRMMTVAVIWRFGDLSARFDGAGLLRETRDMRHETRELCLCM